MSFVFQLQHMLVFSYVLPHLDISWWSDRIGDKLYDGTSHVATLHTHFVLEQNKHDLINIRGRTAMFLFSEVNDLVGARWDTLFIVKVQLMVNHSINHNKTVLNVINSINLVELVFIQSPVIPKTSTIMVWRMYGLSWLDEKHTWFENISKAPTSGSRSDNRYLSDIVQIPK